MKKHFQLSIDAPDSFPDELIAEFLSAVLNGIFKLYTDPIPEPYKGVVYNMRCLGNFEVWKPE